MIALRSSLGALFWLALSGPVLFGQVISDNFDDGEDSGWMRLDPMGTASFSFPGGDSYLIETTVPPDLSLGPARAGSIRADATYTTSFRVEVDLVNWDPLPEQDFGILAFVTSPGLGMLDGYAMSYDTDEGTMYLSVLVNEAPTTIITMADVALTAGETYRFVLQCFDGEFVAAVYDPADLSVPLGIMFGFDSVYSTGVCGIFNSAGKDTERTDATFDNYFSSPDTDVDFDGLTDQWEADHFGDLFSSGSDDNDKDGQDNEYEFLTGSDPSDPASLFGITEVSDAGGDLTLAFPIIADRTYALETSLGLVTWTLQEGAVFTDNGNGTGTLSVPSGGLTPFFGRVIVARE